VVDWFFSRDERDRLSSSLPRHTRKLPIRSSRWTKKLMALYSSRVRAGPEQMHDAFEATLREGHLVPVCFVSAETGAGIRTARVVVRLLPLQRKAIRPLSQR